MEDQRKRRQCGGCTPPTLRRQAASLLLGLVAFSVAALELACRLVGIEAPRLYRTDSDRGWTLKSTDGIPYLPLAQDLQQQAEEQGLIAHGFAGQKPGPGYGHWNREGHKAAASVLARKICSLDLLLING